MATKAVLQKRLSDIEAVVAEILANPKSKRYRPVQVAFEEVASIARGEQDE